MADPKYECKFCGKRFVHEARYFAHRCKQMIRDEEFRTPIGQAAWILYQKWMKAYRRIVPPAKTFLHSKKYTSFIKFAKFVQKTHIPDTDSFIWLMREKDIDPTIWSNDQVYSMYIEFLDRRAKPTKQAEITVNTVFKIADAADVEPGEVFDILEPNEVIELFRRRQFSPWLLLHSSKFKQFFIDRLNQEQKLILETIIRPKYWGEKFQKYPEDVENMKKYVKELNL